MDLFFMNNFFYLILISTILILYYVIRSESLNELMQPIKNYVLFDIFILMVCVSKRLFD